MQTFLDAYAAQPFWFWLVLGVILLAIESALSTEWLLWPAVAAGVVAVITAVGLRLGLGAEIAVFALLTLVAILASSRLVRRVNPSEADINDRASRLIGQKARVTSAFVGGAGRVFVSGAEWSAEMDAAADPAAEVGDGVVVTAVTGSGVRVRPA